jgi:hypothetical protein
VNPVIYPSLLRSLVLIICVLYLFSDQNYFYCRKMERLTEVELSSIVLEDTKLRTWEKEPEPASVIIQVCGY